MSDVNRVLAATDFSEASDRALDYACNLAEQLKSELHLLHVEPGNSFHLGDPVDRLHAAGNRLGQLPARISPSTAGTTRAICEGKPADQIVQYAREHKIGTIVMGTRGRRGVAHALLGSVAETVIRTAPCPVVV